MTAVITETVSTADAGVSHAKPALEFVSLNVIDFQPQVRTSSGLAEDDLLELAESLKAQGMLQPVLLRPLGERFVLIAGERRCRAAHLAGFSHVPALIGEADDLRAATLQLVENVQREDLSLLELAAGLRSLADQGKTLTEICQLVKKSKSWVSKHLAASVQNLGWNTRQFLESETTEDLELVLVMNQIEKTGKWYPRGTQLVDRIEAGKAGREEARALLATLKEELAAEIAQKKADKKAAKQGSLALDGDGGNEGKEEAQPWSARNEMAKLQYSLEESLDVDYTGQLNGLNKTQLKAMANLYKEDWEAGKAVHGLDPMDQLRRFAKYMDSYVDQANFHNAAFILGTAKVTLTVGDLAQELKRLIEA